MICFDGSLCCKFDSTWCICININSMWNFANFSIYIQWFDIFASIVQLFLHSTHEELILIWKKCYLSKLLINIKMSKALIQLWNWCLFNWILLEIAIQVILAELCLEIAVFTTISKFLVYEVRFVIWVSPLLHLWL